MKILLTGATGFLGSHLLRAFLAQGHQVVILKRSTSNLKRIKDCFNQTVAYDIDQVNLSAPFLEQGAIDAVVHTSTCYGKNGETYFEVFDANTLFPLGLLEAACAFKVKTFFNTDTFFKKTDGNLYKYLSAYTISKKQFLEWGKQYSLAEKIQFINICLEHMYGPEEDESKFTSYIISSFLANTPELKLTPGDQKRDFIYINDVISAYLILLAKAVVQDVTFQEYELGSGKAIAIKDFVTLAHNLTSSKTKILFGALPYRDHEIMQSKADTELLKSLGWLCKTSLPQGISKIIELKGSG